MVIRHLVCEAYGTGEPGTLPRGVVPSTYCA